MFEYNYEYDQYLTFFSILMIFRYFLDQLVQETIDTVGASVLDRYGTLPIMLQALLELSATISDRYVKSVFVIHVGGTRCVT